MSAQVINFPHLEGRQFLMKDVARIAAPKNENSLVSRLPFEFVYRALFYTPDPTPEDLLREKFLLECD